MQVKFLVKTKFKALLSVSAFPQLRLACYSPQFPFSHFAPNKHRTMPSFLLPAYFSPHGIFLLAFFFQPYSLGFLPLPAASPCLLFAPIPFSHSALNHLFFFISVFSTPPPAVSLSSPQSLFPLPQFSLNLLHLFSCPIHVPPHFRQSAPICQRFLTGSCFPSLDSSA